MNLIVGTLIKDKMYIFFRKKKIYNFKKVEFTLSLTKRTNLNKTTTQTKKISPVP